MRRPPRFEMRINVQRQGTPLLLAVSLHAAAVGTLVWMTSPARAFSAGARHASMAGMLRPTYMQTTVNMTLADARPKTKSATPAALTPTPKPAEQATKPITPPIREARVVETPKEPTKAERNTSAAAVDSNAARSKAAPAVPAAGDMLSVDGEVFPDRAYLNRIVRAISQEWSSESRDSSKVSEVQFTIHRDGSVSDIAFSKKSFDFVFDAEAMGAVERLKNARRIGALPSSWKSEQMVVRFKFSLRKVEAP